MERTQKTFAKLVLQEEYKNYFQTLNELGLETLKKRRKVLTLRFAQHSLADGKLHNLFPMRRKQHGMETRKEEKYKIIQANTMRYQNSPIIAMQRLLNE